MMMVMRAFVVLILSVSMAVEADDHDLVMYFSPQQPHSQILPSRSSNSDYFKHIGKFMVKIIEGAKTIINKGEVPGLGSKQNVLGLGTGEPSKISSQKRGSISLDTPPPPPVFENENSRMSNHSVNVNLTYGVQMVKGLHQYPMEDYTFALAKSFGQLEGGAFAVFDGYLSYGIPKFLHVYLKTFFSMDSQTHPFFLLDTLHVVREGYRHANREILMEAKFDVDFGGSCASTAVTAILLKQGLQANYKLVIANVGDSRAVISKSGEAKQLSVDHVPSNEKEREAILKRGGYVKDSLGRGPLVNGDFPLTRAFGGISYRHFISSEPDIAVEMIDGEIEFLVLASQPLWKVMSNQQVVDSIREIKNSSEGAQHLIEQALKVPGYRHQDDISCIVVRFQ